MVSPVVVRAAPKKRGLLSALSGRTTASRVKAGTKMRKMRSNSKRKKR